MTKRGKLGKEGSGEGLLHSNSRCQRRSAPNPLRTVAHFDRTRLTNACVDRLFELNGERLCYWQNNKVSSRITPNKTIDLDDIRLVAESPERAAACVSPCSFAQRFAQAQQNFCGAGTGASTASRS